MLDFYKKKLFQIRASKNYTIPMILVQRVDFEKVQNLLKYQPHDQQVKISLSENEFKETKVNNILSLKFNSILGKNKQFDYLFYSDI